MSDAPETKNHNIVWLIGISCTPSCRQFRMSTQHTHTNTCAPGTGTAHPKHRKPNMQHNYNCTRNTSKHFQNKRKYCFIFPPIYILVFIFFMLLKINDVLWVARAFCWRTNWVTKKNDEKIAVCDMKIRYFQQKLKYTAYEKQKH